MTIFEARCLFDVTESMANDSEDGGDSDADDSKLSVSHSSYTRDYASESFTINIISRSTTVPTTWTTSLIVVIARMTRLIYQSPPHSKTYKKMYLNK
ncbi:hypothetical protein J6590_031981 [Homalodisca vitripennis]|nr:hypothetical protein J6590_031981 [Homalodisca vitripennis]